MIVDANSMFLQLLPEKRQEICPNPFSVNTASLIIPAAWIIPLIKHVSLVDS